MNVDDQLDAISPPPLEAAIAKVKAVLKMGKEQGVSGDEYGYAWVDAVGAAADVPDLLEAWSLVCALVIKPSRASYVFARKIDFTVHRYVCWMNTMTVRGRECAEEKKRFLWELWGIAVPKEHLPASVEEKLREYKRKQREEADAFYQLHKPGGPAGSLGKDSDP